MKDIKILVVDDIEANRVSLQYLIHEYLEDVDLTLASSGEDALKLAYKNDIDIIILDIQMPGLDGFDTAKFLKSNPRTRSIPIIFLTAAFKEEEFKQKGFEIGAIDYLTKPIENLQFINKLKLYIEVMLKTKQLEDINESLSKALEKETKFKSQLQKQQFELVEQGKMLALHMAGNITNQLRQALSVISIYISEIQLNIEAKIPKNDELISKLKTINKIVQDLSSMTETFKDLDNKNQIITFNLNEIIDKAIFNQEYLLEQNQIELIKDTKDEIKITNLPNSLLQVLVNLINNAKKALNICENKKKYIFITAYEDEDNKIIIKLKDNALGIKQEFIDEIFEPYFTTRHESHNLGLGLNIVYKIINDSMKGKIIVRNSRFSFDGTKYEGAEFIITLPKKIE